MPSEQPRPAARKYSLTNSTLVVLPEEYEHEYEEILRAFRESFQSQDPAEHALVLRLAQAHWRSLRSRRVETAILHVTADSKREYACGLVENPPAPRDLNPHEAIAVAFMTLPAEHWQMYLRYDAAIARDFLKTLEALQKLQRTRGAGPRPAKASKAVTPPLTMVAGRSTPLSENGIRSVSQNSQLASNPNENKEPSGAGAFACPADLPTWSSNEVAQARSYEIHPHLTPRPLPPGFQTRAQGIGA